MVDVFQDMERPFLPMLISNWIFAIGIIEYPIRKPHRILSFIYTSLTLAIYGYIVYNAYPYHIITWIAKRRQETEYMFFFFNILLTVSIIISGWFQTKGLHKCILKTALVNHLMEKIGILHDHSEILKRELIKFVIFFVYIIIVIMVNTAVTKMKFNEQYLAVFAQSYPLIIVFIADSSFMNILGYVHYKFGKLNEVLKSLLTSIPDAPLHRRIANQAFYSKTYPKLRESETDKKDYTFVIKTAKLAHLRLVKVCRAANSTYGLHNLLSIAIAFVMIINNVFNIYLSIFVRDKSLNLKIKGFIRSTNWFLYYSIKTIVNSWLCSSICKTSIKSGEIICELYDEPSITEKTRAEIRHFSTELAQNKLEFSAYGVVQIDLTLIQVMISAIGTFVIILIQFQKDALGQVQTK